MMHIIWGHGLMPTVVLVHWFLGLKYSFSHKFRPQGRKSSWISTKLGIVIGYGSGVMRIVGRSGPMITTVPVHWFLPKNGVFIYFSHWREKFKFDLNQT